MEPQRDSTTDGELFSTKREQWIAVALMLFGPGLFCVGMLMPKPAGWVVLAVGLLAGGALSLWVSRLAQTRLGKGSKPRQETVTIGDREYVDIGYGPDLVLTPKGERINTICFVAGVVLLGLALAFGDHGPNADWSPLQAVVQLSGVVLLLGALCGPDLNALIRRMWRKATR